jgi:PAS domain S-box-containing protein
MPEKPVMARSGLQKKKGAVVASKKIEFDFKKFGAVNQALLKILPDLVFVLTKDGIILEYHAPGPAILIVPPEKFLGRHFKKVLPKKISDTLDSLFNDLLLSKKTQCLEYAITISGKVLQFEARMALYGPDKILVIVRDITEQKRLEEALRETSEKYRQLVDFAPAGIYEVDFERQKFVSVNDLMCEYLGYSREEFYSLHPMEILTEESQKLFCERMDKIVSNQPVSPLVEYKIRTKQGSEFWVLLNNRIRYREGRITGASVVIHDITNLKMAEEAVRESEGHLRSLMENAKDFAIYRLVYDSKLPYGLKVVFVSPSLDEIIGPSDLQKVETWFATVHPDDWPRVKEAQIRAFETLKFDEEARIFNPKKGEWRWVRATSTRLPDPGGQIMYVNGTVIDITERKRAEETLKKSHDQLEQRVKTRTAQLTRINEKLKKEIKERKQVEEALSESEENLRFLSNQLITAQEDERKRISSELHDEFGQSLVGLKYQLSHLPKQLKKDPSQGDIEIRQALKLIDGLSENIRRISRDLRPTVLEHLGLWEALEWLFDEGSPKYGFRVINRLPKHRWPLSKEQELIVFRIFQEAMTNIEKHARASEVFIEALQKDNAVVFFIRDDGRGFNLKTVKRRQGLGLTTMVERAHIAGGTLNVSSRKGKGTTITFSIPIRTRRKKRQV